MIAFASNSLLCRLALKQTSIDPAAFTLVRILSGALTLWLIVQFRRAPSRDTGNWISALALFAYAAAFSFAYIHLSAGTGALLLFGAVQATMITWGLFRGERLRAWQIVGLVVAVGGLVVLVFPGIAAPPLVGSVLMTGAGCAWGIYSLRGTAGKDPTNVTAGNFLRATLFAGLMAFLLLRSIRFDSSGLAYAVISGGLTSGVGYVIWYAALPGLKAASAATVQLSVPVMAAGGGIILLGESFTLRLVVASVAILGGIALVTTEKARSA